MRVLLDENLPHKLRGFLVNHDTATVAYLGWGGLKNGDLLKAAEELGFDVFVTGDRAVEHQQTSWAAKLRLSRCPRITGRSSSIMSRRLPLR